MSTWVSAAPVIGTGSLDGFAFGALMTGACALAITGPRRARRSLAARDGAARAAERSGWLCEHVMAVEAAGAGLAGEGFGGRSGPRGPRGGRPPPPEERPRRRAGGAGPTGGPSPRPHARS